MEETLSKAVSLFNGQRYIEFQDSLEALTAGTRAASERQFYTVLRHLAEGLQRLSNGDGAGALASLSPALRRLDQFAPRFRGLNIAALREDCLRLVTDVREMEMGKKTEIEPARIPRLRFLPE